MVLKKVGDHFNKILLKGLRYLLNGRGRRRLKCNFFAQNTYNVLKHKYAKIFCKIMRVFHKNFFLKYYNFLIFVVVY